jgi:hypothetical protein
MSVVVTPGTAHVISVYAFAVLASVIQPIHASVLPEINLIILVCRPQAHLCDPQGNGCCACVSRIRRCVGAGPAAYQLPLDRHLPLPRGSAGVQGAVGSEPDAESAEQQTAASLLQPSMRRAMQVVANPDVFYNGCVLHLVLHALGLLTNMPILLWCWYGPGM